MILRILKKFFYKANDLVPALILGFLIAIFFALARIYPHIVDISRAANLFIRVVMGPGGHW